jgi:predicted DNA-binding protein
LNGWRRSGLRLTSYVRNLILKPIEDEEDTREAERILRRVRAGNERTHTLDEVATRLGLDY